MTPLFSVFTTPRFDRLARALERQHHQQFTDRYEEAIEILGADPYNRTRRHPIRKLESVPAGEGQYRLSLTRWRFRYDITGRDVVLHYCGLRREDTYGRR